MKVMEVNEMSQNKIDLFHINQQEQNLKRSLSVYMWDPHSSYND